MQYDKIQYIVALISEFSKRYNLTNLQVERYLNHYGALDLCNEYYDVMHTQAFEDMVQSLAIFCRNNGGRV